MDLEFGMNPGHPESGHLAWAVWVTLRSNGLLGIFANTAIDRSIQTTKIPLTLLLFFTFLLINDFINCCCCKKKKTKRTSWEVFQQTTLQRHYCTLNALQRTLWKFLRHLLSGMCLGRNEGTTTPSNLNDMKKSIYKSFSFQQTKKEYF